MKKSLFRIILIATPSLLSLLISFFDKNFQHQNLCLFLYFLSIILILINFFLLKKKNNFKFNFQFKILFLIILFLTLITRFIFLKQYPFVSFGDEVRDGGINSAQIYYHQISNFFAYGRYDAHGLIIPTLVSYFYPIFGNSNLTYRIPSAVIGSLDILLIYFFIALIVSPEAGFWSALVLIALPLHLFYSRTQIVVIFSSFLTTGLLICLYFYYSQKSFWRLIFLGSLIGLSFNFHASVKAVAALILLTTLINEFRHFLTSKKINHIFLLVLFVIVGFGPRLLFTPLNIFFHITRFSISNPTASPILIIQFLSFIHKYFQSLLVWFLTPTQSFFNNNLPLINPVLFIFILAGILFLLKIKSLKSWLKYLLFLAFIIPLTNSAITDGINFDHRLAPLFPIAAILVGLSIYILNQQIKLPIFKLIFILTVIGFLTYQTTIFFTKRLADINWNNFLSEKDYLSMDLIYLLKSNPQNFSSNLCIKVSPENTRYFHLYHIQEQYQYFLPQYNINFVSDNQLPVNVASINNNCFSQNQGKIFNHQCQSSLDFACPKGYSGDFLIYY